MGQKEREVYSVDFTIWAKCLIDDIVSYGLAALIVDTNKDNRGNFGVCESSEGRSSSLPS